VWESCWAKLGVGVLLGQGVRVDVGVLDNHGVRVKVGVFVEVLVTVGVFVGDGTGVYVFKASRG